MPSHPGHKPLPNVFTHGVAELGKTALTNPGVPHHMTFQAEIARLAKDVAQQMQKYARRLGWTWKGSQTRTGSQASLIAATAARGGLEFCKWLQDEEGWLINAQVRQAPKLPKMKTFRVALQALVQSREATSASQYQYKPSETET